MTKDKPAIRYFNMGPWPIYVGFTDNEIAFRKEMKRLSVDDISFISPYGNACTHILENCGTLCFVITCEPFNARKRTREQYAALIAHEAMHVIQEMQKVLARNETLGSEAEAYLIQQIVQECLQEAWKSSKVRRSSPEA